MAVLHLLHYVCNRVECNLLQCVQVRVATPTCQATCCQLVGQAQQLPCTESVVNHVCSDAASNAVMAQLLRGACVVCAICFQCTSLTDGEGPTSAMYSENLYVPIDAIPLDAVS
jgi:hypothetical protein